MHELSITQNIVAIVGERAGGQKVSRIRLQIGELSAVMPDAIRFCFDVCAEGTGLEGAVLEIEEIPARGKCNACGEEILLAMQAGACKCGSRQITCFSGTELNIKEMEVVS